MLDIKRFLSAQDKDYELAKSELGAATSQLL